MDDTTIIAFDVVPTDPSRPLSLAVEIDGRPIWNRTVTESHTITVPLLDIDHGLHCLRWIVSGKKSEYTVLDSHGTIVSDSLIQLRNVTIDEIDISSMLHTVAKYTHDCNGTSSLASYPLYSDMGCNGHAEMTFSTPLYLWLLEHI